MKKAVFFDIDGTLLGRKDGKPFTIPQSALEAIRLLREQGWITAICTGRQEPFIRKYFPEFDHFIAMNGTYARCGDDVIYEYQYPPERVLSIIEHFDAFGASYNFVGNARGWGRNLTPEEITELNHIYSLGDYILSQWDPADIHAGAMDFLFRDEAHYQQCLPAFTDNMVLNLHGGYQSGDLSFPEHDKSKAIALFCNHMGVELCDTAAFGDGYNDVTMLQTVGLGVAMGNGVPAAKDAADFVTDSLFDDGVARAIKKLLL